MMYEDILSSVISPPRVHNNGFIQFDIDEHTRLHVWPDKSITLPGINKEFNIHEHSYLIDSTVLVGVVTNTIFECKKVSNGEYKLWEVDHYAVKGHSAMLPYDDNNYSLNPVSTSIISAGESYTLEPFKFHTTEWSSSAATLVKVGKFDYSMKALVALKVGDSPNNEFKRDSIDEDYLWSIVKNILR